MLNETLSSHKLKNNLYINLRVVYSLYKHLKIIPVQYQGISDISFCYVEFCEKENDKNILFKKKQKITFKLF